MPFPVIMVRQTPRRSDFGALKDTVWYRLREYYYNSRTEGAQKTDAEYVRELKCLCNGIHPRAVVVDPSAASFIEALRREGLNVLKADNDVLSGIRLTADLLKSGKIIICRNCTDSIREFSLYSWDEKREGKDAPIKQFDHAMDDIRYFATTIVSPCGGNCFAATFVERS